MFFTHNNSSIRQPAAQFEADRSNEESHSEHLVDENPPGFETVLQMYHKRVFNFAYRLIGNADEASDLTQETFVNAYKAYGRFTGSAQGIYPWLCRILINNSRNKFREMNRRGRYEVLSLDEPLDSGESRLDQQIGDPSAGPERVLQQHEFEARVQDSIELLPPDYLVVVVLRDMQGLSYKEISEVTGITLENVKVRLFRARTALRRILQPYIQG